MTKLPRTLTKGAMATMAAGAMTLATASPAMADDWRDRDRDGIGAEEIIAGAVIIGGIAALAGAFDGDDDWRDDRYRDRRWRDDRYRDRHYRDRYYRDRNRYYGRRGVEQAITRCVRTAEREARRWGGYRFADVTQIRDVDRTRRGLKIKGRIEVEGSRRWRGRNFDRGRFTCYVDRGRPEVRFRGIRGLR